MSNEKFNDENGKFERRDLSAGGVLGFLGGLGIVGVLIYLILGGVYGFLNRYEKAHEPPQNPLIEATNSRHASSHSAGRGQISAPQARNERARAVG